MNTQTGKAQTGRLLRLAMTIVVVAIVAILPATSAKAYSGSPILAINTVVKDSLVKVLAYNLPKDETFTVRMNTHGTSGLGGYSTAMFETGSGHSRLMTFETPTPLYGEYIIDLRIDSDDGKYSAVISFVNSTDYAPSTYNPYYSNYYYNPYGYGVGGPYTYYVTPPVYSTIPTTSIVSVDTDNTVTLQTYNFPANQDFTVRMGPYGTYGINGVVVGTTNSGAGGSFQVTYSIPAALKGMAQIAIRLDSPQGFYAYDWFNNYATAASPYGTGGPVTTTNPVPATYYYGYPSFSISAVVQDSTVTVTGYNFPPNQTFTVRMNYYGSYGLGGITAPRIPVRLAASRPRTISLLPCAAMPKLPSAWTPPAARTTPITGSGTAPIRRP